MTDMLSIAAGGVQAYARALDTVADNVANAGTEGHVRRVAVLTGAGAGARPGPFDRQIAPGEGVKLAGIERATNLLRMDSLRRADGEVAALQTADSWLTTSLSVLEGANAIAVPMDRMFESLSDLANDPSVPAQRQIFLARAGQLAESFNRSAGQLADLDSALLKAGMQTAESLNGLADGLARVNDRMRRASAVGAPPPALVDERDRLLAGMARIATIEVRIDGKGEASVRIPDSGGPLLVDGGRATQARLGVQGKGFQLRLGAPGKDQPAALTGGELAGLSTARARLAEAGDWLDDIANSFVADMNQQHMAGADLDGLDGKPLFLASRPVASPAAANAGDMRAMATLQPAGTVPDMTLAFDGTDWTLSRDDGGGSVSGALPLDLDGLRVDGVGTAASGDVFRIGTAAGAAGIALAPLSMREVAMAPRWASDASPSNIGAASTELRSGPSYPGGSSPPHALTALPDGSLELRDSLGILLGSGMPGDWITGDGFELRLSGNPAPGDSFAIAKSGAASGANGNGISMLSLRDETASGGLAARIDAMLAAISVPLAATRERTESATAMRDAIGSVLSQESGVDLDREAADMLRLQQAYQANARIIQTARETFDTLLNATR